MNKRVFPESFQLLTKTNEMKYIHTGFKNLVFVYFITIEWLFEYHFKFIFPFCLSFLIMSPII